MTANSNNNEARHIVYSFGDFSLDTQRGLLLRAGEVVPLRPKTWSVLCHLVEHRGELVSRNDLIETVWRNADVTDDSITQCISEIRRAVGDADHAMIRTVPRRGFVFEAPVQEQRADAESPIPVQPSNARVVHWLWALAAGVILVAVVALWSAMPTDEAVPTTAIPGTVSVAVLPFADMTAAQDMQYFGDGVAEEILNHLAQVPELRVISRSSSFLYREQPDIPAIADELRVDYVLEGSVRGASDELRVTAQLINAATNAHVWSDTYDHEISFENLIDVQNDIAGSVTAAIGAETGAAVRLPPKEDRSIDPEAMDSYLQGLFYFRKLQIGGEPRETYDTVIAYMQAAIQIEPDWAEPYTAIGTTLHFLATSQHYGPENNGPVFEESRRNLNEAIRLDPEYGPAYGSLAFVAFFHDSDYERAEALYTQAEALGYPRAWGKAIMQRSQGKLDASIENYRRATLRNPLSIGLRMQLADTLTCAGRYEEAIRHVDDALEKNPDSPGLWYGRAVLAVRTGDKARLTQIVDEQSREDMPWLFTFPLALAGTREDAAAQLDAIEAEEGWYPREHASLSLLTDQPERTLAYFERLVEKRPRLLLSAQCPNELGPLANDERFLALVAKASQPRKMVSGAAVKPPT